MHRKQVLTDLIQEHDCKRVAELGLGNGQTARYILENCEIRTYVGVDEFRLQKQDEVTGWTQADHDNHLLQCHGIRLKHKNFHLFITRTARAASFISMEYMDLVFIDADHSYAEVKQDIDKWLPTLKENGIICGHDIDWPDVKRAVEERFGRYYELLPDNIWLHQLGTI